MKNRDLTQGSVLKTLTLFFLPVAAGNVVQQLYNTADSLIVGNFCGTTALAAVGGSAAYLVALIVGFCIALTTGASVVISHYYGAKDDENIAAASSTGLIICALIGLAVSFCGFLSTPALLRFMGTPADTMAESVTYLRIVFLGAVFVIMYNMCAGILRASGDSSRPFIYLFVSSITNIVLDLLFVAVFNWGVAGAAIATITAQFLSFVLSMIRMLTAKEAYRIRLGSLRFDRRSLKKMFRLGVPNSLQVSMYNISNAWIMVFVNSLGTVAVASWSLCGKMDGIFWSLTNATGSAVLAFVGQNYGAGRLDRVRECVKTGLIVFIIGTLIISTLIMIASPILLPFFDSNPDVVSTTMYMLWRFVPFYFLWPVVEVFSNVLRGVGDAYMPMVICGITICAFRIVWLYTAFRIFPTVTILCACYALSWLLAGIALYTRYRMGKWNKLVSD